MPELRVEVKSYIVQLQCNCGGEMLPTGIAKPVWPPIYQHQCQRCGVMEDADKFYPCIDYEPIEQNASQST